MGFRETRVLIGNQLELKQLITTRCLFPSRQFWANGLLIDIIDFK